MEQNYQMRQSYLCVSTPALDIIRVVFSLMLLSSGIFSLKGGRDKRCLDQVQSQSV